MRRAKTTRLREFQELIAKLFHGRLALWAEQRGFYVRPIICTPFAAGYDNSPSGWTIAVRGTPPKGILVVAEWGAYDSSCSAFFIGGGRSRRINGPQEVRIVSEFCRSYLDGNSSAFTIETVNQTPQQGKISGRKEPVNR